MIDKPPTPLFASSSFRLCVDAGGDIAMTRHTPTPLMPEVYAGAEHTPCRHGEPRLFRQRDTPWFEMRHVIERHAHFRYSDMPEMSSEFFADALHLPDIFISYAAEATVFRICLLPHRVPSAERRDRDLKDASFPAFMDRLRRCTFQRFCTAAQMQIIAAIFFDAQPPCRFSSFARRYFHQRQRNRAAAQVDASFFAAFWREAVLFFAALPGRNFEFSASR